MPIVIKTNSKAYDFNHNFGNCFVLLHSSRKQENCSALLQAKLTSKDFLRFQIFVSFCIHSIGDGGKGIRQK